MEHINEIEMEKESQESIVRLAGTPDVTRQGTTGCLGPENSPPTRQNIPTPTAFSETRAKQLNRQYI
jgi:hypothetical protein